MGGKWWWEGNGVGVVAAGWWRKGVGGRVGGEWWEGHGVRVMAAGWWREGGRWVVGG